MTFKSVIAATATGLLTATSAIHNSPIRTRMYEIDEEIAQLQQERAKLVEQLID